MPQPVCNDAQLMCLMGIAPSALVVLSTNKAMSGHHSAVNVMDRRPMMNMRLFGMCLSPAEALGKQST
mgnify:CR=1 FL=1